MTDNVIDFSDKIKEATMATKEEDTGPSIATFEVTYHDGETDKAEGVLITTSSFVAVGTYTSDGHGVDFQLYVPASMVKKIIRLGDGGTRV